MVSNRATLQFGWMILKFREMGLDLTDYPLLASSELYLSLIYSY